MNKIFLETFVIMAQNRICLPIIESVRSKLFTVVEEEDISCMCCDDLEKDGKENIPLTTNNVKIKNQTGSKTLESNLDKSPKPAEKTVLNVKKHINDDNIKDNNIISEDEEVILENKCLSCPKHTFDDQDGEYKPSPEMRIKLRDQFLKNRKMVEGSERQSHSSVCSDVTFSDSLVEEIDIESLDDDIFSSGMYNSMSNEELKFTCPIAPLILSLTPLLNLKPPKPRAERSEDFRDWGAGLSSDYLSILQEFNMLNYFGLVHSSLQTIFSESNSYLNSVGRNRGPPRRILGGEVYRDETWDAMEWTTSCTELNSAYSYSTINTYRDTRHTSISQIFPIPDNNQDDGDCDIKSFSAPSSCPLQIPQNFEDDEENVEFFLEVS